MSWEGLLQGEGAELAAQEKCLALQQKKKPNMLRSLCKGNKRET